MATVACLLHHAFGHLWTGFYRVVEPGRLLRVGPYQGTLGCLEIPFGKGVCGTAAAEGAHGGGGGRRRLSRPHRLRRPLASRDRGAGARRRRAAGRRARHRFGGDRHLRRDRSRWTGATGRAVRSPPRRGRSSIGFAPSRPAAMTTTGYSDRINHALAFAAKHHDRQVRKGLRLPYFTQPANVAIILTRYGRPDDTVVAGMLHDVVEDCVRQGAQSDDPMLERVGREVRRDRGGVAAAGDRAALRRRRRGAQPRGAARRTCSRDSARPARRRAGCARRCKLHDVGTLLADLGRTDYPEAVWERFRRRPRRRHPPLRRHHGAPARSRASRRPSWTNSQRPTGSWPPGADARAAAPRRQPARCAVRGALCATASGRAAARETESARGTSADAPRTAHPVSSPDTSARRTTRGSRGTPARCRRP